MCASKSCACWAHHSRLRAFAGLYAGLGYNMASMRVSPMSAKDGEDEEPSLMTNFLRQFLALVRKNFLSKRRSKLQLVSERRQYCVFLPCCRRLSVLCSRRDRIVGYFQIFFGLSRCVCVYVRCAYVRCRPSLQRPPAPPPRRKNAAT